MSFGYPLLSASRFRTFSVRISTFDTIQDAALMLEHSTNRHTEQLREIFCQAGKLYGSEIDRRGTKADIFSG